jgi:hypothetical protein
LSLFDSFGTTPYALFSHIHTVLETADTVIVVCIVSVSVTVVLVQFPVASNA